MIRVVDAHVRRMLDWARWQAVRQVLIGAVQVGIAAVVVAAVNGVFGPVPVPLPEYGVPLAWVLVGVAVGDAATCVARALEAWRELRAMRRNREYLAAVIAVQVAEQRAEFVRLGSTGDVPPAGGVA